MIIAIPCCSLNNILLAAWKPLKIKRCAYELILNSSIQKGFVHKCFLAFNFTVFFREFLHFGLTFKPENTNQFAFFFVFSY